MGGVVQGATSPATAAIYVSGRIATNILTITQAFATAAAQILFLRWAINKQQDMWDHVAHKQINCVEVALDEFVRSTDSLLPTFKDAYPDVPEAARFVPVDVRTEQYNQMVDNIVNGPKTAEYMAAANHWHRINYTARVELLSPGFTVTLAKHLRQVEALMAGQLPVDEAIGVTTDVAENAAMTGKIGNTRMATPAALGIRRLQIQALGRGELGRHTELLQKISPVETEVTFDSLMVKPERRIAVALEQAQLLQNDLQNFNNMKAQKAPHKLAELQAKLQRVVAVLSFSANKANMQNQFVPNFAGIFGPVVSNLATGISSAFQFEKDAGSAQDLGGHLDPGLAVSGT